MVSQYFAGPQIMNLQIYEMLAIEAGRPTHLSSKNGQWLFVLRD